VISCTLCGSTAESCDDEHVIPKWARRAFDIQGWVTLQARDHATSPLRHVGQMQHLNIVLRDAICRSCNNDWLGGIEKRAARILKPMAVSAKPTHVDAASQALLALWAVKTALLLELAFRQQYPEQRLVGGYLATPQELAWLRARNEPPPRSMAWLGCWDCQQSVPVNYEPSSAVLPTADGTLLAGHLTTFTLGYVAFQVFTIDFLAADQHGAPVWNSGPPEALRKALPRIWPQQPSDPDVNWPPPAFGKDAWHQLVAWNGVLRPGEQPEPAA
jgi:hypothetical protein